MRTVRNCLECGKPTTAFKRGKCSTCYSRERMTPGFQPSGPQAKRAAKERLLDKIAPSPGGCWIFTGGLSRTGYGSLSDDLGKVRRVHRLAYELFVGPIPEGLHIDHLCRVRSCVNPDHLEPVPQRVNTLRGVSFSAVNAAKTHCAQGHEYTPENTYLKRNGDKPPTRQCRRCTADWQRAYLHRKKQRASAAARTTPA